MSERGAAATFGPLLFERRYLAKVWGGTALAPHFGFEVPADVLAEGPVGETWELVDREAENSIVRVGPQAGRSLGELVREHPGALLGSARPGTGGRFPLLVKYIDAGAPLSVQVHPDEEAAARLGGGAEAKTEAWLVLAAGEGACVWAGLRERVTDADLAAALATGDGAAVVPLLRRREVRAGDCVLIEGGCVHAIGPGVTILEVQQNSDTTYRIHDWGRLGLDGRPRATHPEGARASARPALVPTWTRAPEPTDPLPDADFDRTALVDHPRFRAAHLRIAPGASAPLLPAGCGQTQDHTVPRILALLEGQATLHAPGHSPLRLQPGDVALLPASLETASLCAGEASVLSSVESVPG